MKGDHDEERFTLADIPGIIEGASEGKGLGLEFLRHISRTRVLIYVLDVAIDPVRELEALQNELRSYDPSLLENVALIALNKVDTVDSDVAMTVEDELATFGLPVLQVSAAERTGLDELRRALFELLPSRELWAQTHGLDVESDEIVVPPLELELREEVQKDGSTERIWLVKGGGFEEKIERFARHLEDAAEYLSGLFKRQGLYNAPAARRRTRGRHGGYRRVAV